MVGICNYCTHEEDLTRITKLRLLDKDREVSICQHCFNEMLGRGEIYRGNNGIYLFTKDAEPRLTFSKDRSLDNSQRKF
jgi:hypothetical protein